MPVCDICGSPSNGFECDWPVQRVRRGAARAADVVRTQGMETSACRNHVCDRCMVERDDRMVICKDHWNSWEAVA